MAYLRFSFSPWYVYYSVDGFLVIYHTTGLYVQLPKNIEIKSIEDLKEYIKNNIEEKELVNKIGEWEWEELYEAVKQWFKDIKEESK